MRIGLGPRHSGDADVPIVTADVTQGSHFMYVFFFIDFFHFIIFHFI